jgi:hypothetical protein
MRQSFKKPWVVTGLALLGAMIAGGPQARGDLGGLTITGGFTPATSDPFDYIFQVYSTAPIKALDSFTIKGLVGVTSLSFFQPDNQQPNNWTFPVIDQKSGGLTQGTSDVSWGYFGPTLNNPPANQPVYLGQFVIETMGNQTVPAGTIITYSYSVDGNTVNASSSFVMANLSIANLSVPEPASSTIVLLIGGTAALSGLVVRARRRRSARTT